MSEWKPYDGGQVDSNCLDLQLWPSGSSGPEFRAAAKWDGCVHLYAYSNGVTPGVDTDEKVEENTDYLHICHLEEHIDALTDLLEKARKHYGKDWP